MIITCQSFAQFVNRGRSGSKYGGPKGPTQTKKENANKGENITKQKKKGCYTKKQLIKLKHKTYAGNAQFKEK